MDVEDWGRPVSKSWESEVVEVDVPDAVPLLAVIILVPTPNSVIDPSVVVRIVDPLVTVETMADVVMADVEGLVTVEEYEMYDPVGRVTSEVPVKTRTSSLLELES